MNKNDEEKSGRNKIASAFFLREVLRSASNEELRSSNIFTRPLKNTVKDDDKQWHCHGKLHRVRQKTSIAKKRTKNADDDDDDDEQFYRFNFCVR